MREASGKRPGTRLDFRHSHAHRVLSASRIARPHKCLLAVLSTVVGSYLSVAGVAMLSPRVVAAAVVMGLVCAFGFIVNDYRDATADGIGKPSRPIPSGVI